MRKEKDSGQILLIVVLTMIVALTVGLSVVSRTITDLRISRQGEESQRAFQAAEAGIQQVLETNTNTTVPVPFDNSATYISSAINVGGPGTTSFLLNGGDLVDQDTGMDVWLSDYSITPSQVYVNGAVTNPVTIYWGTGEQSCTISSGSKVVPAIEVVMLTRDATHTLLNPKLTKYIYNPTDSSCAGRISGSGVLAPSVANELIDNITFQYKATISFAGGENGILMKVIPLFGSTKVGVKPTTGTTLPLQGKVIDATGNSGQTARKIRYFSSFPQIPPEVFPYSLISQ